MSKRLATEIGQAIADKGGKAFFVGGMVRDALLNKDSKDIDIEVFGINRDELETILGTFGTVNLVGKSFGVYKLGDIDISVPRLETKTGDGHKGFTVIPNPFLDVETAMRRRDFTINAIYQDVLTGEIVDKFGGLDDLANGIIRVVDKETFKDDSLRVLRATQFASRLGFTVVDADYMWNIDLSDLPSERIFGELEKLLLGENVKHGLETLAAVGATKQLFPELDILFATPQDPIWHPEGDVWTHTLMVVNEAQKIVSDLSREERLTVMLACLFHDLGKATTTEIVGDRVKAHGHAEAGVPIAEAILDRLNVYTVNGYDVRKNVLELIERHLVPMQLYRDKDIIKDSVFKRLSLKVNLKLLPIVCKADVLGRGGDVNADCVDWFNERVANLDLVGKEIEPILKGRHLIGLGMKPSSEFGVILDSVFDKQLEGIVNNLDDALKVVEGMRA